MFPPLRMASIDDGALLLSIHNLALQAKDVNADVRAIADAKVALQTVRLWLLDNDGGWSNLPGLLKRLMALRVPSFEIENAVVIRWSVAVTTSPRGDYVARALGSLARPRHVEAFALRSSGLSDEGLQRLRDFLTGLAELDLSGNDLRDAGLNLLAAWGDLALEHLRFDGNRPTARGIEALARARLPQLSRVTLRNCQLGAASARRLLEDGLPALTDLALAANPVGDDGAEAIAESPGVERLSRLELSATGITDQGAKKLANSPHLHRISALDLRGNRIGDPGRKLLHDRFGERVRTGRLPDIAPPPGTSNDPS